jgi:hypothetical protein
MATEHPSMTIPKTTPCGCIQQASEREGEGGGKSTTCAEACCGTGCRCMELKGRCDCAERLQAHETTAMGKEERVPKGCIVEAGASGAEACPTCGVQGCHCIEIKGSCDCPVAQA